MSKIRYKDIKAIVAEKLAEQHRLHHDDIDAAALRAVTQILTTFGIEETDRQELRADFQYLRLWRKSVEHAKSYTPKAVITIVVTGFAGAMWLGFMAMFSR